ncbi:hypothetical protein D3C83_277870 [compost metagenome]
MPPSAVPPFCWGAGPDLREHRLDKFLETAERAMGRRKQTLSAGMRRMLQNAWHGTVSQRNTTR